MQTGRRLLILLTADLCLLASAAPADTHYVSWSGTHVPPFTNWTDAATNIQAAVDVAEAGDEVVVGDGAYTDRGPAHPSDPGALNLVLVTNALTLRSENGASNTYLMCMTTDEVIRCVWLASNAVLDGFTLEQGRGVLYGGGVYGPGASVRNCRISRCRAGTGGGAYGPRMDNCELNSNTSSFDGGGAAHATLQGCSVFNNEAGRDGGGVAFGTLDSPVYVVSNQCFRKGGGAYQCSATSGVGVVLSHNQASYHGGGAAESMLYDTLIASNMAPMQGGGAYDCQLTRCELNSNNSGSGGGAAGGSLSSCLVAYNQAYQYGGGICGLDVYSNGSAWAVTFVQSCTSEFNIVGNAFLQTGDGGGAAQACDVRDSTLRGNMAHGNGGGAAGGCILSNCIVEMNFAARGGAVDLCDVQDSRLVDNNAQQAGIAYGMTTTRLANCEVRANRTTGTAGWNAGLIFCEVTNCRIVENSGPAVATDSRISDSYIGSNGCNFGCMGGDAMLRWSLLTNITAEANSNFIAIADNCQIYSSSLTRNQGADSVARFSALYDCIVSSNSGAIYGGVNSCTVERCQIVGNFGWSVGGANRSWVNESVIASNGSAWCAAVDGTGGGGPVVNTAIVGNYLVTNGSSPFQVPCIIRNAELLTCTVASNRAEIGEQTEEWTPLARLADSTTFWNSRISENRVAGGPLLDNCTLNTCTMSNNTGRALRGLISNGQADYCRIVDNVCITGSTLRMTMARNCLILGNVGGWAGGAFEGSLSHCTLFGNAASNGPGGVRGAFLQHSIVFNNTGSMSSNWLNVPGDFVSNTFSYSCTAPNPGGPGTFAADPGFRDPSGGDYRLAFYSPCINAGSGPFDNLDLAGNPRTLEGVVDIGAYENQGLLELRVVLSGAHTATGSMRTALQAGGSLPSTAPYAEDPRGVGSLPANVVDWVLVQLVETNTDAVVASRSLFLRNDGRVMDENGSTQFRVVGSPGPVRVALKHRNHLAVMTDQMVAPTGDVVSVDLAADPGILRGGTTAVVEVASGIWALRAGNVDGDDEVRPADELIRASQE